MQNQIQNFLFDDKKATEKTRLIPADVSSNKNINSFDLRIIRPSNNNNNIEFDPSTPFKNYTPPFEKFEKNIWSVLTNHLNENGNRYSDGTVADINDSYIKELNRLRSINKLFYEKISQTIKTEHSKSQYRHRFAQRIHRGRIKEYERRHDTLVKLRIILCITTAMSIASLLINWFQVAYTKNYRYLASIATKQNWTYYVFNTTAYTIFGNPYPSYGYQLQSPAICNYATHDETCGYDAMLNTYDCNSLELEYSFLSTSPPAGFWFAMLFFYATAIGLIQWASHAIASATLKIKLLSTLLAIMISAVVVCFPLMTNLVPWVNSYTVEHICLGFWSSAIVDMGYYLPAINTLTSGGPFPVQHSDELLEQSFALQAIIPQLAKGLAPLIIAATGIGFTFAFSYILTLIDYCYERESQSPNVYDIIPKIENEQNGNIQENIQAITL